MDTYFIYDLEYSMPFQQVPNICEGQMEWSRISNQKKVYIDGSRSLSIESESMLALACNKMDLVYWTNIVELGEKSNIIIRNTDLRRFNQVFDNYTMFHYFVNEPSVIESICKQYKKAKEQGLLTKETEHIPLLIMKPDKDGETALDKAIRYHRALSFRLMLDLILELSQDFCLTKSMLNFLPLLIGQGTFTN